MSKYEATKDSNLKRAKPIAKADSKDRLADLERIIQTLETAVNNHADTIQKNTRRIETLEQGELI
jgi:hypothetical protein